MKITYSIWQGSLYKGTLTATKMKDVIATVKELNDGNTSSLKFEHMVNKIEQVA
jgi:CRISPR/Cas system-associated endoribonuclease Cas2